MLLGSSPLLILARKQILNHGPDGKEAKGTDWDRSILQDSRVLRRVQSILTRSRTAPYQSHDDSSMAISRVRALSAGLYLVGLSRSRRTATNETHLISNEWTWNSPAESSSPSWAMPNDAVIGMDGCPVKSRSQSARLTSPRMRSAR